MDYIIKTVTELIKKFKTNDPYMLCERLDITVSKANLPKSIKGFFMNILDDSFIYIDRGLNIYEEREVLSHELGHAILHPNMNTLYLQQYTNFSTEKLEKEADKFAANLLLYGKKDFFEFHEQPSLYELSEQEHISLNYVKLWANSNFLNAN